MLDRLIGIRDQTTGTLVPSHDYRQELDNHTVPPSIGTVGDCYAAQTYFSE